MSKRSTENWENFGTKSIVMKLNTGVIWGNMKRSKNRVVEWINQKLENWFDGSYDDSIRLILIKHMDILINIKTLRKLKTLKWSIYELWKKLYDAIED